MNGKLDFVMKGQLDLFKLDSNFNKLMVCSESSVNGLKFNVDIQNTTMNLKGLET